ncbi:MAG: hypothetical protein NC311_17090 [Muribaculaceae bacterium]|nr:hypothetical protein [Muribaculaceae bacterium]
MAILTPYQQYLQEIEYPERCTKLVKMEFLNPDNSVAYALDNNYKRGYGGFADSRAFLQDGSISVSLNNGQRRKASVSFEDLDGAFDYAVNKLWYGNKVKLSAGIRLKSGQDFYLPQGVFYFDDPKLELKPNSRKSSYSLVDKWAYLDGSLFGNLENTYEILNRTNIFEAMAALLQLSRYDHKATKNKAAMIDCTLPVFTSFYNNRTITLNGSLVPMCLAPKTITVSSGGAYSNVLLDLNKLLVGWIGYDEIGALRVDASQEDIDDLKKPVLWAFTVKNGKTTFQISETAKPTNVFNDIIVFGETLDDALVGVRATNLDPASDTNANLIGRKTFTESSSTCYTVEQCRDLASWYLKQKTVLQKSVTISCPQLFHLRENNIVTVLRDDKDGSPLERHLIQSYSLPLSQSGNMSITATSTNDFPKVTVKDLDLSKGI